MDPEPRICKVPLTNGSGSRSCYFRHLLKVHLHHFSKKKKVIKKSQNSGNQGLSYYFCLMIKGSGSGAGFAHLAN
jgi:hypothetical protein